MSYDPYADCPCGSGNKIKFCCQDVIPAMQKVARLRENQPTRARQILEDLQGDFPENLWVASSHARLLMELSDYPAAMTCCETYLARDEVDKQSPEINGILALAAFVSDGYESAKRNIHRAFQLSARKEPDLVSRLAGAISMVMLEAESFMSARAHAAIALKLAPPDRRSHYVMQLAQIEGSSRIPYPLRSVHRLVPYTAAVEDKKDFDRAVRLSSLGCWKPAAILLGRLAEKHPEAAELCHNLALCEAWDGNEPAAATALHKAASLYEQETTAVECETLAQLLDIELTEDVNEILVKTYKVDSVSKLLTDLDKEDCFARLVVEFDGTEGGPVAHYHLLNKAFPASKKPEELAPADVPEFIADIRVFDAADDQPARLEITGVEGEGFANADKTLNSAAAERITLDEEADDEPLGVVPIELEALEWNCHFPSDFPATLARDIETRKMETVATDTWPNLKLSALGGKTPNDVKGDASLATKLKAAVFVLDAFYDRNDVMLDIDALRKSLDIEIPPALVPNTDNVTGLSTMSLQRIDFAKLDTDQLVDIARRVLLVRHTRVAYDVLTEVANRDGCVDRVGAERVFSTLVGICREQNLREEAIKWLVAGRDAAQASDKGFRNTLEWDVRELNFRMDDPTDPEIPTLWKKFETEYLPKLPEMRDSLIDFMFEKGLGHMVSEVEAVTAGVDDTVWTPESAADKPEAGGEKKLWIPGQD